LLYSGPTGSSLDEEELRLRAVACLVAAALVAFLPYRSLADDPAPEAAPDKARAATDDENSSFAQTICLRLGFANDSPELRHCAAELVALREPGHLLRSSEAGGRLLARTVPGFNLGAACARYYPAASRRVSEEGTVDLVVYVGADTRVKAALVLKSSGHERLDLATAQCVSATGRFVPPSVDGVPVGSWQGLRYTWRFTGG
jgi:TonB family protein